MTKNMYSKIIILILITILIFSSCSEKELPKETIESEQVEEVVEEVVSETDEIPDEVPIENVDVSPDLNEIYTNENYMLEMLINKDCLVVEDDGILTIYDLINGDIGNIRIQLTFIPGVQNLSAVTDLLVDTTSQTYENSIVDEVTEGSILGAKANIFSYAVPIGDDDAMGGISGVSIINQSAYFLEAMFTSDASDTEHNLLLNLIRSMNILQPVMVDEATKTATYESKYTTEKAASGTQTQTVSSWNHLPYYYYAWYGDLDRGDLFDELYYQPDYDYYSSYDYYWDWGWDDSDYWYFYDDYYDYYDYDAYSYYDDYDYYDYDWSEYYNEYSDPGDYYYEDDYDYDDYDYYDYYDYDDYDYYDYDDYDYYDYDDYDYDGWDDW